MSIATTPQETPLVSIIIPCYNDGNYLRDAIVSAQNQTYPHCEIIIIDDHSTNARTRSILQVLAAEGLTVLQTPKGKKGPAAARNTGIRHARGKYILPLDADDKIAPTYAEKACLYMETSQNTRICTCRYKHFGLKHTQAPSSQPISIMGIISLRTMIISSSLFRRADWEVVGGYNETLTYHEDRTFWVSLLSLGGHTHEINDILFYYRIRPRSLCAKFASQQFVEEAANAFYTANADIFSRYGKDFFIEHQRFLFEKSRVDSSYTYKFTKYFITIELFIRKWIKRLMGRA